MNINIKNALLSNKTLKVVSLIIGTSLWLVFSQSHTTTITLDVPISFYAPPNDHKIDSPEQVKVTLSGRRSDLYALDLRNLALHIDGQSLQQGPNNLEVSPTTLFLPEQIKLVHWFPSNVVVTVHTPELA